MFHKLYILFAFFFSIYSISFSQEKLQELNFLLARWEIKNFSYENNKWIELGITSSNIESVFDGKFLNENVSYLLETGTINMNIYIGFDYRKNSLKMCAMDKEFGVMDIYFGSWQENNLVFTNLRSDLPIEMPDEKKLHFRLTYSKIEENSFTHTVEGTYDFGKSWFPFAKSVYSK